MRGLVPNIAEIPHVSLSKDLDGKAATKRKKNVLVSLSNLARNGFCGAVAGGSSKFLVYPLVIPFASFYYYFQYDQMSNDTPTIQLTYGFEFIISNPSLTVQYTYQDTLKKRMQVQVLHNTLEGVGSVPKYSSSWNCLYRTFTEEGVKGLYKVTRNTASFRPSIFYVLFRPHFI
jgi:hypothetical protein